MALVKISQLPAGGAIAGADLVAAVQTGVTVKSTITQISTFMATLFDALGAAATAQANAEAYTDTKIGGAAPVIDPGSLSLPNGKTFKGNGSNAGAAVDAAVPIEVVINGGGSAIVAGTFVDYQCKYDGTIADVSLFGGPSGSLTVEIEKCTYAQYDFGATHPVAGDKITASAPPAISSGTKYTDSTLTGWTLNFSAGDILRFIVTGSPATITQATCALKTYRR